MGESGHGQDAGPLAGQEVLPQGYNALPSRQGGHRRWRS